MTKKIDFVVLNNDNLNSTIGYTKKMKLNTNQMIHHFQCVYTRKG